MENIRATELAGRKGTMKMFPRQNLVKFQIEHSWMRYSPVYTDYINGKWKLAYDLKEADMTKFKCDTRRD
jgi:hypothetical protein